MEITSKLLGKDLFAFANKQADYFFKSLPLLEVEFEWNLNVDENWIKLEVLIANMFMISQTFICSASEDNLEKRRAALNNMHYMANDKIESSEEGGGLNVERNIALRRIYNRYHEYGDHWKSFNDDIHNDDIHNKVIFVPNLVKLITNNIFYPELENVEDALLIGNEDLTMYTHIYIHLITSLPMILGFPDKFEIID